MPDRGGSGPLATVRVLDLTSGRAEMTSRYLGDLGAEVLRVGLPGGGLPEVDDPPAPDGPPAPDDPAAIRWSLRHATHNFNKHRAALDLATDSGRAGLEALLAAADILVEDTAPGTLDGMGLAPGELLDRHPHLVMVSVTDFGQTGPYRDWAGSEWTHLAMGAVLARSGIPGATPLLPPGSLAVESAAMQAAWAGLLAYVHRLDTGVGEHVDVAVYESAAQVVDPGFGIGGTGAAGARSAEARSPGASRDRPDARHLYPIFPCADGHVRICVLSVRQWRGMRAWLGDPAELADPALDDLATRFAAVERIYPLVAALFASRSREDLVAAGQGFGVPIAALLSPREVLASEHFAHRRAFTAVASAAGPVRVPDGFVEIDGVRAGLRRAAPRPHDHAAEVVAAWQHVATTRTAAPAAVPSPAANGTGPGRATPTSPRRPLEGVRVLDLGVIIVGAELGRLLADQGAEVIKVENRAFPDGSRQATGGRMTASFARGHRNKTSVGIDLRRPEGATVFKELVARSDVVLSNFKPGTMGSLGLGYEVLAAINPGIVVAESSALGADGPWSRRMGYGPLVRASTSLSGLWAYPGVDESFSDASTVYPDHVAARVGAVAVLAALVGRRRHGRGARIAVSQAETMLGQFADLFALEQVRPGSMTARGNVGEGDAPRGVYRCAGDDDWCVVDIRGDQDWRRLCRSIGHPELAADARYRDARSRVDHRDEVDDLVGRWTAAVPAREAMTILQSAGVPAGMMQRVDDLPADEHLTARGFFTTLDQPQLARPVRVERSPAQYRHIPDPPQRPAPLLGEQTRQICVSLLGMSAGRVDELLAAQVLEEPFEALPTAPTLSTAQPPAERKRA